MDSSKSSYANDKDLEEDYVKHDIATPNIAGVNYRNDDNEPDDNKSDATSESESEGEDEDHDVIEADYDMAGNNAYNKDGQHPQGPVIRGVQNGENGEDNGEDEMAVENGQETQNVNNMDNRYGKRSIYDLMHRKVRNYSHLFTKRTNS